jgi:hypothetical protein
MRSAGRSLAALVLATGLTALAACGPANPVLGDWELDREETTPGAVFAVEATDLERLSFTRDATVAGDTEIPGSYVVEEARVRFVREDGRGEHAIELLPDGRIRVELPIGVRAVYRRAG